MKKIYLFDHEMNFQTFKMLQEKLNHDSGPTPKNIDSILWEMMRDKQVYIWIDPEYPEDPIGIGTELPKAEVEIISNPPK